MSHSTAAAITDVSYHVLPSISVDSPSVVVTSIDAELVALVDSEDNSVRDVRMPSVSVLPSSPAHRSFGAGSGSPILSESDNISHSHVSRGMPSQNGIVGGSGGDDGSSGSGPESTVAEIKDKVRSLVNGFRGASAISLLRSARDQAITGASLEAEGALRGAYRALLLCAQLSQAVLGHAEFKAESQGKKGVVWNEWEDFQRRYGMEALAKAKSLEMKLLEMEKEKRTENDRKPGLGSSIADRIKSLQDTGLKVQSTKRISRDFTSATSVNGSVSSPPATAPSVISRAASSHSPNGAASSSHASSSIANHATGSSVHSVVSSASIGPPSPLTPSNDSTRLAHYSISEFTQAFPSIDELDEGTTTALPQLPSVPTNKPGTPAGLAPVSPSVIQRFPSIPLDLDPGPRPASTPIAPTANNLPSRPPSPLRGGSSHRSPLSPAVPPKPLNLTLTGSSGSARNSPSRTSPVHTGDSAHRLNKAIELPKTNSIAPKVLHEFLGRGNEVKVLLLDVRTREEFSNGHIKSSEVVCLEPHILSREGLTSEKLEDALVIAPQHESALFRNRDKFDLVVMYDWDSESFGPSITPLSSTMRIIYETVGYKRALKRPPVLLVGGFNAWVSVYPNEIVRDGGTSVPQTDLDLDRLKLGSPTLVNGNGNGSAFTSTYMFKDHESPSQDVHPSTSHSRSPFAMDQIPEDTSSATMEVNGVSLPDTSRRLARKPTILRPPSSSSISFNIRGLYDNSSPYINGSHTGSSSSISYPSYPRPSTSSNFGAGQGSIVSPPPTASINPSLSRRRSDYIDQSEQAVSSFASRPSIDYPDLSAQHVVRPPPAVATPPSERQDQRRVPTHALRQSLALPDGTGLGTRPPIKPTIDSDYPVLYWPDTQLSTAGLKNLGNTCYMNSTIQCLSATVPFARFFIDGRWKNAVNYLNHMGTKGRLTQAFASILHDLWYQESPTITPYSFRKSICAYGQQFAGSEQHDSQEFLNFLLDGLHEDLNRILNKEPIVRTSEREAELETLPQQIASQQEWNLYRMRDDSIVVDFFQGQFRNRMECMTCRKTSTTYNSFMYLTLPIPSAKNKMSLQQCLDAFVQEEVMEKEDAWQCPNCKTLRKATKKLSISRLPPVLLIHLKRFTTKGHFTDKLETFVDFPLKGLDLTNYMPAPLPPGVDRKSTTPISLDDPRSQIPPYRYDLYAVTNHFGTLSSGHYTAFINSRGNWLYCDDSRISNADSREVVGKPAYVLYYKRIKA
ncbi:DOA4 [Sanghuangporus sanghuang]